MVELLVLSRDSSKKKIKCNYKSEFILPAGKLYHLHGMIPAHKFSEEWKDYLLQLRIAGKVIIDDFVITAY